MHLYLSPNIIEAYQTKNTPEAQTMTIDALQAAIERQEKTIWIIANRKSQAGKEILLDALFARLTTLHSQLAAASKTK